MNYYVESRMKHFQQYFDGLLPEQQNKLIRAFIGSIVTDILAIKSRREYSEILAWFLVESGKVPIGIYTFEKLVDKVEEFLENRIIQIYPRWQQRILDWFQKKSEQSQKS